uniref:Uncharacterized protein n=1 Tax=Anser brachyrhynchus TaxID=132585 RepID=A0A8B9CPC3_9AVES
MIGSARGRSIGSLSGRRRRGDPPPPPPAPPPGPHLAKTSRRAPTGRARSPPDGGTRGAGGCSCGSPRGCGAPPAGGGGSRPPSTPVVGDWRGGVGGGGSQNSPFGENSCRGGPAPRYPPPPSPFSLLPSKPWEQIPKKPKRKKRRRRNVNCLRHAVIWYEDHRQRCPYEPRLAELDPAVGLYTTAVWQCERGHRYFQDLHCPLPPPASDGSDSDGGA